MKDPGHGYLADLVVKAQGNDTNAFSELYALTYDKVYNYSRHYLRDSYLAQDAVQEVYILALKKLKNLKDPMLFTAWLNQISFRVCYDICKKRDSDYGTIDDDFLNSFRDENTSSNPEERAQQNGEQSRLKKAIENLPHLQRTIVIMRFFNDMKLEDIADAMDISLSSVKRYIDAAKQTLRSALQS